jgi:hypothetical protein
MRWILEVALAILSVFITLPNDARPSPKVATIVSDIQRADYEGDRAALTRLREELTPFVTTDSSPALASRVLYWRGFALWRRAINGFNETPAPQDLEADLTRARDDFRAALARDPNFVDAKAAEASCTVAIGVLHRGDPRGKELVLESYKLVDEALAAAPDNPRLLWVHGMNVWYKPVKMGGGQDQAVAIYNRALDLIRKQTAANGSRGAGPASGTARTKDPLEPTWGEPELLANLAWSNLHRDTPDVAAAERFAKEALVQVPNWHYVRDILLVQIRQASSKAGSK